MAKSREQYIWENSESNYDEDLISFSLIDEATIKRRQREGDIKLPSRKVDVPKDERWNTKQLNSKLLQGILNGDSIPNIAKSLLDVIGNNEASAVRNARTMITQAECGGRQDSYEDLADQGVVQKKVWIATPDDRTRESHIEIDGEEVDVDDNFSNGLAYPADPSGEPEEVWNCRCSIRTHIIGFRREDGTIVEVGHDRDKTLHDKQMAEEKERRGMESAGKDNMASVIDAVLHGDVEAYEKLKNTLDINNVEHRQVDDLPSKLSDEDIINKLAGGDMTRGSCASLALSYCGNKAGMDVTDYRDGKSRDVFSRDPNIINALKSANADMEVNRVSKETTGMAKVLKDIEPNTEYLLACGRHAAIVKSDETNGLQYLELQSKTENGWKQFEYTKTVMVKTYDYVTGEYVDKERTVKRNTSETLNLRFGCRKTVGGQYILAKVDSVQKTEEFKDVLGYINTDPDKQRKGATGGIK